MRIDFLDSSTRFLVSILQIRTVLQCNVWDFSSDFNHFLHRFSCMPSPTHLYRRVPVPGDFPDLLDEISAPLPTFTRSFIYSATNNWINWLLVFFPLGFMAGFFEWSDTYVFIFNFFAIVPLAKLLGLATEEVNQENVYLIPKFLFQLAMYTSQSVGGLLNATFGNLVEMIVSVLALKKGIQFVVSINT